MMDLINRQDAIDALNSDASELDIWDPGYVVKRANIYRAVRKIEQVPTAVKRGTWRDTGSGQECSVCKEIQYGYDTYRNYCAYCGAYMGE